jgi:hypothetical protein
VRGFPSSVYRLRDQLGRIKGLRLAAENASAAAAKAGL